MKSALQDVLNRSDIWSGDGLAKSEDSIASGFSELDAALPGSGWPQRAFTEIILERQGIGELRLVLPALSRLSRAEREIVLIAPPHIPYAPAFAQHGIALSRLLWVRVSDPKDKLWAAEQALRSGACGAVLCWLPVLTERIARRLQLAAEAGKTWGVQFTPAASAASASPAPLRMHLNSSRAKLQVRILKRRGGGWVQPLFLNVDHVVDLPAFSRSSAANILPHEHPPQAVCGNERGFAAADSRV